MNAKPQQFRRLYRAFLRKDARLDGRVFIAVRTTGIYCLLTCRARTPKPENVHFYFSRAEAEKNGFRPCRKCRPEVQGGQRALERAALRTWLVKLAEEEGGIGQIARAEGRSPSGLYRMFRRQLGRSPQQARGEARLRRACDLLRHKDRSVVDVAFEAGFSSLATFYRWFRRRMEMTPSEFRHREANA